MGWNWESLTLEEKLVMQLRACGHYFRYGMGQKSGQQRILSLLSERGGLTQRELQDMLGVQPGSLSEILSKVEAGGYIRRRQNERDRRQINLELTEDGENAAQSFREGHSQMMVEMFSALSEEEKQQLSQLLGKMMESWPRPAEAGPHGPEGRKGPGPRGGGRGRGPHGGEMPDGRPGGRSGGPRGGRGQGGHPGRQPGAHGRNEAEVHPEMRTWRGVRGGAERPGMHPGFDGRMWPEHGDEMGADRDEAESREEIREMGLKPGEESRESGTGIPQARGEEEAKPREEVAGLDNSAEEARPDYDAGENAERGEA